MDPYIENQEERKDKTNRYTHKHIDTNSNTNTHKHRQIQTQTIKYTKTHLYIGKKYLFKETKYIDKQL